MHAQPLVLAHLYLPPLVRQELQVQLKRLTLSERLLQKHCVNKASSQQQAK